MEHFYAKMDGKTGAQANVVGAAHDGLKMNLSIVPRSLHIDGVHLEISAGNQFFKAFLLCEHEGPIMMSQRTWKNYAKQLRTKFTKHFNTPIALQMTANLSGLIADESNHEKLLNEFVPEQRRPIMRKIFTLWVDIVEMIWRPKVTPEDALAFQETLTGDQGFGTLLFAEFPSMGVSDYMHMLLDHSVPLLIKTGGMGPLSCQPSEAVHKDVHKYYSGYARSSLHEAFTDVLLRLFYKHHPLVRKARRERRKRKEARRK